MIEERNWLIKKSLPRFFDCSLIFRALFQWIYLPEAARRNFCSVLFVPGGSYLGRFHPVVTMSRNLLPFEAQELKRYGFTIFGMKLRLLRIVQRETYKKADGLIFLTNYARDVILQSTGELRCATTTIPHGINSRFERPPVIQKDINSYTKNSPFKIIYVSTIDYYKHQVNVIEAIKTLRNRGLPINLDLIGSAYAPALRQLIAQIKLANENGEWVRYHGTVSFNRLHHYYGEANMGVFASSCENMPNILLEMMASSLPIASSNRGPMKEILQNAGLYFDPERPDEISNVLFKLISNPELRFKLAEAGNILSKQYSWSRCASRTFQFLIDAAKKYSGTYDV